MPAPVPPSKISALPVWAWMYSFIARSTPNFRGKYRVLCSLRWLGVKRGRRFVWRMENGNRLLLDPREGLVAAETVGWTCFLTRRWEPHVEAFIAATLRPGDTAIDVGANIGYFTAVMAEFVSGTGRVISFEPVPDLLQALTGTVRLNGLANVEVLGCALGAETGRAEIHVDPRIAGSSSLHVDHGGAAEHIQVSVRTLDELAARGEIAVSGLRLIKIDVEGAELDVLRGAVDVVRRWRPWIVFELNGGTTTAAGWTLGDAIDWFDAVGGYSIHALTDRRLAPLPTRPLAVGQFVDLVAVPDPRSSP